MPFQTIREAIADVENLPEFMKEFPSIIELPNGKFDWFCLKGSKAGYYNDSNLFVPLKHYTIVREWSGSKWIEVGIPVIVERVRW